MTYVLFVCLFSAATAWHTWHSNPLYSSRSTVRFTLVVFLTLAGVLAAIISTVNLTKDAAPNVALTCLLGVMAISALALIYAVTVATSPPLTLPAGTALLTTMRQKMTPWILYTGALVLATLVLLVAMPDDYKELVLSLGGLVSFGCIVLVFVLYLQSLGYDRGLTAIELHPWVRWTYSADQWKQHTQAQVQALRAQPPVSGWKRNWSIVMFGCLALLGAGFYLTGGMDSTKLLLTVAVLCVLGATFAVTAVAHDHAPHAPRAFLIVSDKEACFGEQGLFVEGRFSPWVTSGSYLETASIDPTAGSLVLTFEQMTMRRGYMYVGSYDATTVMERVPLPDSPPAILAADLDRLARGLKLTCPEAAVNLS